ncbi:hypothetical protein K443DRAFT_124304 [Laccaria amethystina LaAM-08-1]|uniref:Unplaced genomic scaffold K443scaffold_175, whole genome shotgun sequence n=1 Tax=Laccaria amethystina LaAM-08-1 TaxID=1095629 RepID=A0A0C9XKU4_9AGAR|nr:hypothetical protein K443DRAFT_124304 [Laccaria amethystina LaAM-08-1]
MENFDGGSKKKGRAEKKQKVRVEEKENVPDQSSEFQNTKDTSSSATAGPDKKADALGKPWETTVENQDDVHEMNDLMGSFQCNPCSPDSNLKELPLSTVLARTPGMMKSATRETILPWNRMPKRMGVKVVVKTCEGKLKEAPTLIQALAALKDLRDILNPPQKTGAGHKDPGFDLFVQQKVKGMMSLLNFYMMWHSYTYGKWGASALQVSVSMGRGRHCACELTKLDLANDINLYLQEIGKDITAIKLVHFLACPEGQYADGHECEDVVWYRDHKFLPNWKALESRMENWTSDNEKEHGPRPNGKIVIPWHHNEAIFYANDWTRQGWYHKDGPAKPYTKGEGASLMPGKNRDGYMTAEDISTQAEVAMGILTEFYPEYEHIFIYDNAPTHLKCPEGSLSARWMPKNIPKDGRNWGIEVTKHDNNGKAVYLPDGSTVKQKIKM